MTADLTGYEPFIVAVLAVLLFLAVWGVLHFLGMLHNYLMHGWWR